jgi:hypothetical protein
MARNYTEQSVFICIMMYNLQMIKTKHLFLYNSELL